MGFQLLCCFCTRTEEVRIAPLLALTFYPRPHESVCGHVRPSQGLLLQALAVAQLQTIALLGGQTSAAAPACLSGSGCNAKNESSSSACSVGPLWSHAKAGRQNQGSQLEHLMGQRITSPSFGPKGKSKMLWRLCGTRLPSSITHTVGHRRAHGTGSFFE